MLPKGPAKLPPWRDTAALLESLRSATALWHREPAEAQQAQPWIALHATNFRLWHLEDDARAPRATDAEIARVKRAIDTVNQQRNDLVERIDQQLLQQLPPAPATAELHSETAGMMLDRLSILELKRFHTEEQLQRVDVDEAHRERNRERAAILQRQIADLAAALDRLWQHCTSGTRTFRLYRQLKMYNDPELNPRIYASSSAREQNAESAVPERAG